VPRLAGLEGGHAVRDGFHPRQGRASRGEGAQYQESRKGHGLRHHAGGKRDQLPLHPAPETRAHHEREGAYEEIGGDGEYTSRLADTAEIREGGEGEEAPPEGDAMRVERGERRGKGGPSRRHAHRDGEDVVDQERGGGNESRGGPEIGPGHDVGAAARG